MKLPKLKICKRCQIPKGLDKYYSLTNKQKDSYCKECRLFIQKEGHEKILHARLIEQIKYYGQFPQFDYSQGHSVAMLATVDIRNWPFCLAYINNEYQTNYNYKDTYIFIKRIGSYICRYFTYKKCANCGKQKQTYINSDKSDYVFEILEDVRIPIIPQYFILAKKNKDGWSANCDICTEAVTLYRKKVARKKEQKNALTDASEWL